MAPSAENSCTDFTELQAAVARATAAEDWSRDLEDQLAASQHELHLLRFHVLASTERRRHMERAGREEDEIEGGGGRLRGEEGMQGEGRKGLTWRHSEAANEAGKGIVSEREGGGRELEKRVKELVSEVEGLRKIMEERGRQVREGEKRIMDLEAALERVAMGEVEGKGEGGGHETEKKPHSYRTHAGNPEPEEREGSEAMKVRELGGKEGKEVLGKDREGREEKGKRIHGVKEDVEELLSLEGGRLEKVREMVERVRGLEVLLRNTATEAKEAKERVRMLEKKMEEAQRGTEVLTREGGREEEGEEREGRDVSSVLSPLEQGDAVYKWKMAVLAIAEREKLSEKTEN